MDILISKDSKGKIRIVKVDFYWDDSQLGYVIRRVTSQYGGKETVQPFIVVSRGKAKRTVTQQRDLEYNAIIKKYLDKGYKKLPDTISLEDKVKIEEFLGEYKTNQEGILKPMLAKQADKVSASVFNKEFYASRKINGCFKGDTIISTDRGPIRIDKIVEEKLKVNVLSYNFNTNQFEYKPIINWFNNGKDSPKNFVRIQLGTNKYLTCTKNHKFYNGNSWEEIKNLKEVYKKEIPKHKLYSLLMGTILGDSCLCFEYRSKKSLSFRLCCSHKELELLKHKVEVLGLEGTYKDYISGYGSHCWKFISSALTDKIDWTKFYYLNPETNRYERFLYTAEYLNNILDDSGVSLWIADDGSISYNNGNHETPILHIATQGWTYEQVVEFQRFFQIKYNITPDFITMKDKVTDYQAGIGLKFRTRDALKLLSILKEHKFKTVEYKYYYSDGNYEQSQITLTSHKVELKPVKLTTKINKYDIEVADNHNYFANGFLVHNCRSLIYCDKGEIKTASRGAINYDLAIYHIISHPKLEEFFKNHPDAILDGEIYKHGWTLNKISGICRTQSTISDGKDLQFYWYDIVDLTKPFTERLKTMEEWSDELGGLIFEPERCFTEDELAIQFVPHTKISGWSSMKSLHDRYVAEGWEGLVIRKADSLYQPGMRNNNWIKIKEFQEFEYEIAGLSDGLRDEDLCFIMKTPNGQEFKAKPMGDREQKQWYREHIDELIGKMGTLKYFEMSGKEGSEIPQQPIFICVRDYE